MLLKFLLVLSILIQSAATVYALRLVRTTKYNSVWILFIVGFSLLSVERVVQLLPHCHPLENPRKKAELRHWTLFMAEQIAGLHEA